MKTMVVLSDLHMGDPCSVFHCETEDNQGNEVWGGPDLSWLKQKLHDLGVNEKNRADYLVLAGDVLDFSIASYKEAYSVARRFFTSLRKLRLVNEVIYIPGNHDKDVWDSVQKEVKVFMRLRDRRKPRDPADFPYEQPGIIDFSTEGDGTLKLPGVSYAEGRKRKKQYGKLFLEGLFRRDPTDESLPVSVVYPNLYLILPGGKWILVTHGHLFQLAWVFITEVFDRVLAVDREDPPRQGLKWVEECNIPANSLICTGLGQGGPSTRLIRQIQAEAKEPDAKRRKMTEFVKVLETFLRWADGQLDFSFFKELAQDIAFKVAKKEILREMRKAKPARHNRELLDDNKGLVRKFLQAARFSLSSIPREHPEVPMPDNMEEYPSYVIFGHTHEPTPVENPDRLNMGDSPGDGREVKFFNTGSCLRGEAAAIILVDEEGASSSLRVEFPAGEGP